MRQMFLPVVSVVVALGACTGEPDAPCTRERQRTANQLTSNVITSNKLAANGLLGSALPSSQLTGAAVADVLGSDGLADAEVRRVLEYAVGCALGPEQSIEIQQGGVTLHYAGAIGLAPQWGEADGACDAGCQGWVSACLIARTNFLGQSQPISLLGAHPRLTATDAEAEAFDVEEATYFGQLFGPGKTMYACVPDGAGGPERTCGDEPSDCVITVLGACSDVCDDAGCRGADGSLYAERITVNASENASCQ